MTRVKVVLAAASVLMMLVAVDTAAAGSPGRVSEGDAEAVLQAFPSGGWAVNLHSPTQNGAPGEGLPGSLVVIRPISGTAFNGAHYCALDWHTIGDISFFDAGPRQAFASEIAGVTVTFTLDGAPLPVSQTAIKRWLNPEAYGLTDAYYTTWGRVMAPSDLAPGAHVLSVLASDSNGIFFTDGITFVVDPAGTGVCQ